MFGRLQGVKRSVDNFKMHPYTTAEIIAVKVPCACVARPRLRVVVCSAAESFSAFDAIVILRLPYKTFRSSWFILIHFVVDRSFTYLCLDFIFCFWRHLNVHLSKIVFRNCEIFLSPSLWHFKVSFECRQVLCVCAHVLTRCIRRACRRPVTTSLRNLSSNSRWVRTARTRAALYRLSLMFSPLLLL